MSKLNKIILFSITGLLIASPALALQLEYPDWFPIKDNMKLSELAIAIFEIFLVVAGVAAFAMIVVGGFRYIVSSGSPSAMTDARSQIFSALLGLVLLLGSYLMLNTINPELVQLQEPNMAVLPEPDIALLTPNATAPRTILVTVEKPRFIPAQGFNFDQGVQEIPLETSLKLLIDTSPQSLKTMIQYSDPETKENTILWKKDLTMGTTVTKNVDNDRIRSGLSSFPFVGPVIGGVENIIHGTLDLFDDIEDKGVKVDTKFTISVGSLETGKAIVEVIKPFPYGPEELPMINKWTHNVFPFILILDPGRAEVELKVGISTPPLSKSLFKKNLKIGGTTTIKETAELPDWAIKVLPDDIKKHLTGVNIPVEITITLASHPGICGTDDYDIVLYSKKDQGGDSLWCFKKSEIMVSELGKIYSTKIQGGSALLVYSEPNRGRDSSKFATICFNQNHSNFDNCKLPKKWGPSGSKGNWEDDFRSIEVIDESLCPDTDKDGNPVARQTFFYEDINNATKKTAGWPADEINDKCPL